METYFFFFLGLAFILTHEMDAIRCHEWRIFPLTARLNDQNGFLVFMAAHVPLYLLLFLGLFWGGSLNHALIIGLDLFFIVHLGLHLLYYRHPKNKFTTVLSWVFIAGAGAAGAIDLVLNF